MAFPSSSGKYFDSILKQAKIASFQILPNSSLTQPFYHLTLHNVSSWKSVAKYRKIN